MVSPTARPRGPKGIAKEPVSGMIEVTKTRMAFSGLSASSYLYGLYVGSMSMITVLLKVSMWFGGFWYLHNTRVEGEVID